MTTIYRLWGISAAQGYKYFKTYRQDPLWLKTLVSFCLPGTQYGVIGVQHLKCLPLDNLLSIVFQPAYDYHGDKNIVYVHYIIISTVQGFYALHVWIVSEKKKFLVIVIVVLSLVQLVSGLYGILYLTIKGDLNFAFAKPFVASTSTAAVASVVCDITISFDLVYYLKARTAMSGDFGGTQRAITTLVMYSINIGVIQGLVSLGLLITFMLIHFSYQKAFVTIFTPAVAW
ncbi:hypothetical protein M422DRAFT_779955 [Sphaerobolus stellatus SS14]|uniref:Uncharacterized protein n=1 Tax=Sphaerobolus stellatus (strain SS14) TaxID=990650 RepID=A0A0C9VLV7_SPHS4|nr:hypothetical protein M422DRAFT_779955 [Sphaerobolus stellatus SS14]